MVADVFSRAEKILYNNYIPASVATVVETTEAVDDAVDPTRRGGRK